MWDSKKHQMRQLTVVKTSQFSVILYITRKYVRPYSSSQYDEEPLSIYVTIIIAFTKFHVVHLR